MRNTYIAMKFLFPIILSVGLIQSCSTSPLLTENIKITPPEKLSLETKIERTSTTVSARTNLKNFTYPSEEQLLKEANIKNTALYSTNMNILADWILKDIPTKYKNQLAKNCEILVGQFDKNFPLDETTIACSAWWIEKQNTILAQEKAKISDDNPPIRMTEKQKKNWANFKNLTMQQALPLIDVDSPTNVKFYIKNAIQFASTCSLKNANASLLLKLENYLPNQQIYTSMERIYAKMQLCLTPNEDPAEKIHLRMGLLRLLKGEPQLAFEALKKTQLETDPKENSRNLFWLGTIFRKNHANETINPYWQQLLKENPLSLAAIVANQQMGTNPANILVPDENISLQNRSDSGWTKENIEIFIFENLLARNKKSAAVTWANSVSRTISTTNPELNLYWAVTQNKLHSYFNSIQLFSRYMRYQKNYVVSRGLIDLQFPRVYLSQILEANNNIDPIFILALMRQESAFDENARSSANARGLMQVLPYVAKSLKHNVTPNDLYEPDTNIEIGSAFLEKLFKKYDGKSEYVLAAYNAGGSNLDKWLTRVPSENTMLFCDFIPFKESRTYVSIILRNYYWYSRILAEENNPITEKMLQRSLNARFKSERVQALLSPTLALTESQKKLLNGIYFFGNENRLSALAPNNKKNIQSDSLN